MKDYSKGKIYKVVNEVNGMTYYGSTIQKLYHRMGQHREAYHTTYNKPESRRASKTYKLFGDIKDCEIVLIENYPCSSKLELETRERYYIENFECVNIEIPTRTKKEHYEANKVQILAKNSKWNRDNKEKRNELMDCSCGFQYSRCNRARHLKSKKHLTVL